MSDNVADGYNEDGGDDESSNDGYNKCDNNGADGYNEDDQNEDDIGCYNNDSEIVSDGYNEHNGDHDDDNMVQIMISQQCCP